MASNGRSPGAHEGLRAGNRAFAAGDYGEAARQYAHVVAEDGACASGWYNLGNARLRRGDREGAVEAYRRALAAEPGKARAWHNLSTALLAGGRWAEAAEAAERAVALDPSRAKSWNDLGVARHAMGRTAAAEEALRRALAADPGLGLAAANLGLLLLAAGRADAAHPVLERALGCGHDDAPTRLAHARALAALGRAPEAAESLAAAVRSFPAEPDLWTALGDLRREAHARGEGGAASALEAYEAAFAAASDMPDAVRARVARRRLRAALALAEADVTAGGRADVIAAAARVHAAALDAAAAHAPPDPAVAAGVLRCVEAARERGAGDVPAGWVEGVLENAVRAARAEAGTGRGAGTAPGQGGVR
jgi:tetratricopeptide (TPR) repeat protein